MRAFIIATALLMAVTVISAAPHKGGFMGMGMGMEEPPPPPVQPGITTIFYSPFFPVLPPHPYGGSPYPAGGGGAPYGAGLGR